MLPWRAIIGMETRTDDLKLIVDQGTTVAQELIRDRKKKSECKTTADPE